MQYLGGKVRLAKHIAPHIIHRSSGGTYLEPFVGGGSVLAQAAPHFANPVAADMHEDLVLLWQALADGWEPPTEVTEDEYRALRTAEPSALRGFAGFACSFGGKWFGGYARGGPRNYAAEGSRRLLRLAPSIKATTFVQADYRSWPVQTGVTAYCDPPYAGTETYGATDAFDPEEFWSTMRDWVAAGGIVLVSEFTAPDDWAPVWSLERKLSGIRRDGQNAQTKVDRLYMHESQAHN